MDCRWQCTDREMVKMEVGKSTRVLVGVILIAFGCTLNAAEKGSHESQRRMADDRNNGSLQFEPLKRQLMDFTALRDRQRLTMPRLHGSTQRVASRPRELDRLGSWSTLSGHLARLSSRLFAVDRLPGHW